MAKSNICKIGLYIVELYIWGNFAQQKQQKD